MGSTSQQNVHLGKKDTVRLDVSSYPPPKYTWSKDGQALTFDDSRRTLDQYTGNVVLNPVMESDEGNYSCTVEYNGQLQPHVFPVIVVGELILKYSQSVYLTLLALKNIRN